MNNAIEAFIKREESAIQVAASISSAGQALPSSVSSKISLATTSYGGPLQYKVGADDWKSLDREQVVYLAVDLSKTTVMVRKFTAAAAPVPLLLAVESIEGIAVDGGVSGSIGGGAPITLSGTPTVGSKLTAVVAAGWQNAGGNWQRNGVNISSATGLEYTLVSADVPGPVTYKSSNLPYTPPGLTVAAAGVVPVPAVAPVITTAPQLAGSTVGQPVTLTPGTVTGTPAPTVTYSWRDAGGTELSTSASAFTPVAAGQLTVVQRAVNSAGDVSRSSNTVTVASASVPPAITAAPVLSAITAGGVVTFTQGTVTGTPTPTRTYSLMRGSTVLVANLTSGDTVAGTVGDDQVFVRLVASSSGMASAQADSNTVIVKGTAVDPYMIASHRAKFPFGGSQYSASTSIVAAVVHYSPPYETRGHRALFVGYYVSGTTNTENNFANSLEYSGAWIEVDGVRKRLKVNGSNTFSVAPGANVFTDPDDSIVIPAGRPYRLIVTMNGATGQDRPANVYQNYPFGSRAGGLNDSVQIGTSDFASIVDSGVAIPGGVGNLGKYALPGAAMIVAKGWAAGGKRPVVLITGSSSAEGVNDDLGTKLKPPDGVWGAIARAFADNSTSEFIPNLNLARTGVYYSAYTPTTMAKRIEALSAVGFPFTTILSDLGRNDSPDTVVGAYPGYVAFMRSFKPSGGPNRKFVQTTLMSSYSKATTANIGFTTIENQTPRNTPKTAMQALNPVVRGGATSGQDDWIEQTGITDANRMADDWAWKPGTQATVAAAYDANATTIVLTAAPEIGERLAINPGTGTYTAVAFPTAVTPNTPSAGQFTVALRLEGNTQAAAVGDVVIGVGTTDGIHGDTMWALKTAPVFVAAKAKLLNSAM